MNKIIIGSVLVVVLLSLIIFINPQKVDNTVKIIALYPMTGGLASWGESSKAGTDIAVAEINNNGGINGKKLEIEYQDHKCDSKTAVSIITEKSTQNKFFTSSSCSGTVIASKSILEKNNALLLAQVVASTKISNLSPNIFRNWPIETRQAKLISDEIIKSGYKKIGILYEETDYAKGLKLELDKNLLSKGVVIVSESFVSNATDIRTQIVKIKDSNPDAVFISSQSESSSEVIFKQLNEIGYSPKLFVNDIVLSSEKLLNSYKRNLEGAIGGVYIMDQQKVESFSEKNKKEFIKCSHINACLVAYDSIYILAEALKKNASFDGVLNYLKALEYSGVSGYISFDENNDRSGIGYTLSKVVDGKVLGLK